MTIHKGYCEGCPFNVGHPATEIAYNLGCLPSTAEVADLCERNGTAWACHSVPWQTCCGHAERDGLPLQHTGVHGWPNYAGRTGPYTAEEAVCKQMEEEAANYDSGSRCGL